VTLKIRGISNAENLLMGVNKFGHCLTNRVNGARCLRVRATNGSDFDPLVRLMVAICYLEVSTAHTAPPSNCTA